MKTKFITYIQLDHRNPNRTIELGLSSINQAVDFLQVQLPRVIAFNSNNKLKASFFSFFVRFMTGVKGRRNRYV